MHGTDDRAASPSPGGRVVAALWRHRASIAVFVVALVVYGYAWAVQPIRPQLAGVFDAPGVIFTVSETGFTAPPELAVDVDYQADRWGWYGAWYDQYHYGQMARALARFELPGTGWDEVANRPDSGDAFRTEHAAYAYGLGYSVVAVPFVWLGMAGDPYVVLDGLLMATSAVLALAVFRRFLGPGVALVAVLALLVATPLPRYFAIPYGTSTTVVAVLAAMWALVAPRIRTTEVVLVAASTALCASSRYVDAAWPALIVALALLLRGREARTLFLATAGALVVTVGLTLWSHEVAFGSPFTTPYEYHNGGLDTSSIAYQIDRIPDAFVGVFLTGDRQQLFGVDPILRQAPWLALAPVGLLVLFLERHPLRWAMLGVTAIATVATLQYLAWFFGGVQNLRVWNIRFYHSWFALWTVLAAVALERGVRWLGDTARPPRVDGQLAVGEADVAAAPDVAPRPPATTRASRAS